MAHPPQTFSPSLRKLVPSIGFAIIFFVWALATIVFFIAEPSQRPSAWVAYVLTSGVPAGMFCLSIVYLWMLIGKTTVDEQGVRISRVIGSWQARWADVVGYDIVGTKDQGISLYLRDGRQLGISFVPYEGDELKRRIDAELAEIPRSGIEGRVFWMSSRWVISIFFVGLMAFIAYGFSSAPSRSGSSPWIAYWFLVAMLVPLIAFALTDRVMVLNGELIKKSCFGTKRLALADIKSAEIREVSGKGGRSEILVLKGSSLFRISAQREGYAMLRDGIISQLPQGVLEDKR